MASEADAGEPVEIEQTFSSSENPEIFLLSYHALTQTNL
jgi:hypothetical protein